MMMSDLRFKSGPDGGRKCCGACSALALLAAGLPLVVV